jgi:hypothetical protein
VRWKVSKQSDALHIDPDRWADHEIPEQKSADSGFG